MIPFHEADQPSTPSDRRTAPAAAVAAADGTFSSRGVKNNNSSVVYSSKHKVASVSDEVASASATAAAADDDDDDDHHHHHHHHHRDGSAADSAAAAGAPLVTHAEDAAGEISLGLDRVRDGLTLAARAEAAAAKEAIEAERTATAIAQAAAAAIGPSPESGIAYSSRNDDGGSGDGGDGVANGISNSRGASAAVSGARRYGDQPTDRIEGPPRLGGSMAGSPLQISFAKPTDARTTIGLAETSSERDGRVIATRVDMEELATRFRSHGHSGPIDAPVPSSAKQRQHPLYSRLGPPYPTSPQPINQEGQTHVAKMSQGQAAGRWRGGWGGGDAILTTFTSLSSSTSAPFPARKIQPVGATSRRLASFPGDAFQRGGGTAGQAAWRSEIGSKSETASAVGGAGGEQEEAEWIRKLLFSGPGMPGLVVDLWSPGPMFLRHIEVGPVSALLMLP